MEPWITERFNELIYYIPKTFGQVRLLTIINYHLTPVNQKMEDIPVKYF